MHRSLPCARSCSARRVAGAALAALTLLAGGSAIAADPPPDLPAPAGQAAAKPAPPQPPPPAPAAPYGYPPGYPYGYGYPPGLGVSPSEAPPGYAAPIALGAVPQYPYPYSDPFTLPPAPPRERYNRGWMASGIVMTIGGLAALIAGSALVSTAHDRIDIYCDMPSFPCASKDDGERKTAGAILMVGGALAGAAGVPLWIIGSKMVPIKKRDDKGAPAEPAKPAAIPTEVRVGIGGVSLRF